MHNTQQPQHHQFAPQQPVQQPAAAMAFTLDENSAMQAGVVPYITETGAYVCTIQQAQYRRNTTGSHAVVFRVVDNNGKPATFTLTYLDKDNATPVFGANFINAMLYLSGVNGFSWLAAQDDQGQPIQVAQELAGITLGLVLESVKNQNDDGRHMDLRHVYDPASGRTASEAKEGKEPEAVKKLLEKLTRQPPKSQ